MAAYRRLGRLQDCLTVLGLMRQHGVRPSDISFGIIQQACRGHLDATAEVRQVLRLMEDMKVAPSTFNYNALIVTYADAGQFTNALQVGNRLREASISWDQYTYQHLLRAAVTAGQAELTVRLLNQMRSDGLRPMASHYLTVFLGLAQAGYYEDALRIFERLQKTNRCSTQAYNVMLGIHGRRGNMEAARELLESMQEAALQPDVWSYRILLEGYYFEGDFEAVLDLEDTINRHRDRLQLVAKDPKATPAAREVAEKELENQTLGSPRHEISTSLD